MTFYVDCSFEMPSHQLKYFNVNGKKRWLEPVHNIAMIRMAKDTACPPALLFISVCVVFVEMLQC